MSCVSFPKKNGVFLRSNIFRKIVTLINCQQRITGHHNYHHSPPSPDSTALATSKNYKPSYLIIPSEFSILSYFLLPHLRIKEISYSQFTQASKELLFIDLPQLFIFYEKICLTPRLENYVDYIVIAQKLMPWVIFLSLNNLRCLVKDTGNLFWIVHPVPAEATDSSTGEVQGHQTI